MEAYLVLKLIDFITWQRIPQGCAPRRAAATDAQASSTPPGFLQWRLTGSDGRVGRERCRPGLSGPIWAGWLPSRRPPQKLRRPCGAHTPADLSLTIHVEIAQTR